MKENKFFIGQEVEYVSVAGQNNTPVYKFGMVIAIQLSDDDINIVYVVRRKVNYFSPLKEEIVKYLDEITAEKNMRVSSRS